MQPGCWRSAVPQDSGSRSHDAGTGAEPLPETTPCIYSYNTASYLVEQCGIARLERVSMKSVATTRVGSKAARKRSTGSASIGFTAAKPTSRVTYSLLAATILATMGVSVSAQGRDDERPTTSPAREPSLEASFHEPPQRARPYAYWHWLDGNISKEGLKLDFEWMRRAGMGGLLQFDGAIANNTIVPKRVTYMSQEWREALRYSLELAKVADIEVGIASSPGWSQTGAPFVQPRDAMKKLVWSEMIVPGGKRLAGPLPHPPVVSGSFQDVGPEAGLSGKPDATPTLYGDVRVVAYRLPPDDITLPEPRVSTAAGVFHGTLEDGRVVEKLQLPLPTPNSPAWVRLDYPRRVTVSSATIALAAKSQLWLTPTYHVILEASEDGQEFKPAGRIEMGNFVQRTANFPAISGRAFRIVISPPVPALQAWNRPTPGVITFDFFSSKAKTLPVSQIALHSTPRVERAEEKAGFSALDNYYAASTPSAGHNVIVAPGGVVDLTAKLQADGQLNWTPPPGRWRIVRFGWSLTGKTNGPANPEATGLEVDKLNATRVAAYVNTYLDQFKAAAGSENLPAGGLSAVIADSAENGFANWTEDLLDQFKARRGYDPAPYLPALAGYLIGGAETSDRFLYDYRRTIAELIAEAHYKTLADVTRRHGMTSYAESLESARVSLGDDMAMRSHADIPTGAMWQFGDEGPRTVAIADLRGAASVAHLAGKPLVASESMTAAFSYWAMGPRQLKPVVDAVFAQGVNRIIIHSSVHQPLVDKVPGLSLAIFGQFLNRNDTWAEQARAWIDYISRTSFMLQQGRFVADVGFVYGEEAPLVSLYGEKLNADVPVRFGYDYVDNDTLINRMSVAADGSVVTPGGARYRLLQLGGSSQRMTLKTLRKLRSLVAEGATIVGDKPAGSPSLTDDAAEFQSMADELWSGRVGKGRLMAAQPIERALATLGVAPDHEVLDASQPPLAFVHRQLADGELWFISNPAATVARPEISFRVAGRAPDLYDAQTGSIVPLDYRTENGRTIVRLDLALHGSALIVFRRPADGAQRTTPIKTAGPAQSLNDGWTVHFQPNRGAPIGSMPAQLGSLTESKDPGIRYFSGTATYTRVITVPRIARDRRMLLDLGDTREIAEVVVNGRAVRTLWTPPYRVDVTNALRPGRNVLTVKVTNLWVNRLIGDVQPKAVKLTTTYLPTYRPDAPLLPSGLIGPVSLTQTGSP